MDHVWILTFWYPGEAQPWQRVTGSRNRCLRYADEMKLTEQGLKRCKPRTYYDIAPGTWGIVKDLEYYYGA